MDKCVDILGEQYFYIKLHLDEMVAKAASPEEAENLVKKYKKSRRNFYEALDRVFTENNADVKALKEAMKAHTTKIKEAWESDLEVVAILNLITTAVGLGQDLVKLGQA